MSLWTSLKARLGPVAEAAAGALDADVALQVAAAAAIETARERYPELPYGRWEPGKPLKLLFAGYAGTRNTGADVRVEEMIRQFRHVLGPEHLDLTILVHDPACTRGYFRTVKQVQMPRVFPRFLYDQVAPQHGVVACEGSMFKSKFASALSAFMVEALGLAVAGDKLAIAYGGEAGAMTPGLERMVSRYVRDAFVITRNAESGVVLDRLGVPSHLGTDTAWTFTPAPDAVGRQVLRDHGWDGETPLIAVCPINPFWWPVRPDLGKAVAHELMGLYDADHFGSVYFHRGGPQVAEAQQRYLDALAHAVGTFARRHGLQPVCIGMEQLDRGACERLSRQLGDAPVLVSDTIDMFELVSALRQVTFQVSSRYHGIVTGMSAGVLSVGVTMDERIRNLMIDRGTPELALEVDAPDLGVDLLAALERVAADAPAIRRGLRDTVARNLVVMGEMGVRLATHVQDRLPHFPLPDGHGRGGDPLDHLPPLGPDLVALLDDHGRAA